MLEIYIGWVAGLFAFGCFLAFCFSKDSEESTYYGIAALWFLFLSDM
jgi:hypothetical protein